MRDMGREMCDMGKGFLIAYLTSEISYSIICALLTRDA